MTDPHGASRVEGRAKFLFLASTLLVVAVVVGTPALPSADAVVGGSHARGLVGTDLPLAFGAPAASDRVDLTLLEVADLDGDGDLTGEGEVVQQLALDHVDGCQGAEVHLSCRFLDIGRNFLVVWKASSPYAEAGRNYTMRVAFFSTLGAVGQDAVGITWVDPGAPLPDDAAAAAPVGPEPPLPGLPPVTHLGAVLVLGVLGGRSARGLLAQRPRGGGRLA